MDHATWVDELSESDARFVRSFVLSSGSLKALAKLYGISYPTVRSRLNRIISKIRQIESEEEDLFVRRLHALAIDKNVPAELIETIRHIHQDSKEEAS